MNRKCTAGPCLSSISKALISALQALTWDDVSREDGFLGEWAGCWELRSTVLLGEWQSVSRCLATGLVTKPDSRWTKAGYLSSSHSFLSCEMGIINCSFFLRVRLKIGMELQVKGFRAEITQKCSYNEQE